MASIARASSPPDAARASGCTGSPTFAPSNSSTGSPVPVGATATSTRAPGMARVPSRSPTASAKAPAARARTVRTATFGLGQLAGARRALGLQPGRLALGIFEHGQPGRTLGAVGHDGDQVGPVLAAQLAQEAPALLHPGQPGRVVLPRLHLVAQRAGHVGDLDRHGRQPLAVCLEGLVPGQRGRREPELVQGAALAQCGLELFHRAEGRLAVRPGVGQTVLFAAQHRILVGVFEVGRHDLVDLVAQDVGLAGALLLVAPQRGAARRRASATGCAARARG